MSYPMMSDPMAGYYAYFNTQNHNAGYIPPSSSPYYLDAAQGLHSLRNGAHQMARGAHQMANGAYEIADSAHVMSNGAFEAAHTLLALADEDASLAARRVRLEMERKNQQEARDFWAVTGTKRPRDDDETMEPAAKRVQDPSGGIQSDHENGKQRSRSRSLPPVPLFPKEEEAAPAPPKAEPTKARTSKSPKGKGKGKGKGKTNKATSPPTKKASTALDRNKLAGPVGIYQPSEFTHSWRTDAEAELPYADPTTAAQITRTIALLDDTHPTVHPRRTLTPAEKKRWCTREHPWQDAKDIPTLADFRPRNPVAAIIDSHDSSDKVSFEKFAEMHAQANDVLHVGVLLMEEQESERREMGKVDEATRKEEEWVWMEEKKRKEEEEIREGRFRRERKKSMKVREIEKDEGKVVEKSEKGKGKEVEKEEEMEKSEKAKGKEVEKEKEE